MGGGEAASPTSVSVSLVTVEKLGYCGLVVHVPYSYIPVDEE